MTRKEAIENLKGLLESTYVDSFEDEENEALKIAINSLEIDEQYELEYEQVEQKTDVFDKIRAEIETKYGQCDICEYFEDYDYEENDISEYRPIGNIADILEIIDKYRAESEDKE